MSIENDQQLRITRGWIENFGTVLVYLRTHPPDDLHPRLYKGLCDSYESTIETLKAQVAAYESGVPYERPQPTPEMLARAAEIRRELEEMLARGRPAPSSLHEVG